MPENYTPAKGDRVRVVLEGEVSWVGSKGFEVGESYAEDHVVSIEKIEPPVEVFKPGSVVRHRTFGTLYAVGDVHYVNLESGESYKLTEDSRSVFTTAFYEKVSLG